MSLSTFRPCVAAAGLCLSAAAQSEIFSESQLELDAKKFYYDRDYHGADARQSQRKGWAQGMTLDWRSGWTSSALGVGLDLNGMLGIRLDSSAARSGSGLLPRNSSGHPESDYSAIFPTHKARWAGNDFRLGLLTPQLPLLAGNGSRLFPQRFSRPPVDRQWTCGSDRSCSAY